MIYLLDANTLIEAKNRYYSMTICPGYWTWILQSYKQGVVASVEIVADELKRGNDELAGWATLHKELFWDTADQDTQAAFGKVATHVASQAPGMKAGALDEFLRGADPWLIAKAMVTPNSIVVTHEQFNPQMKRKYSIPNVCEAFGVQCLDTFDILSTTQAQFVLQT